MGSHDGLPHELTEVSLRNLAAADAQDPERVRYAPCGDETGHTRKQVSARKVAHRADDYEAVEHGHDPNLARWSRMTSGDGTRADAPFADAVILAAGVSERMAGTDKLMMEVAGLPLLAWTIRAAVSATSVRRVIIVAHPDRLEEMAAAPWAREAGATVVAGGARRQDSVAAGVTASDAAVVLIHDGARPLVSSELFDAVAAAALLHGAAVPIVAVPESMRRVVDGEIVSILDRAGLYRSQTPHGARREVLAEAYRRQNPRGPETFIDETTLVQAAGIRVATVPGEATNLKVTLPGDADLAIALLAAREHQRTTER